MTQEAKNELLETLKVSIRVLGRRDLHTNVARLELYAIEQAVKQAKRDLER